MAAIPPKDHRQVDLLRLLTFRMERLSADSIWARRASGLRRSLVKAIESIDNGGEETPDHIQQLIIASMDMLTKAAQELPDPENPFYKQRPI